MSYTWFVILSCSIFIAAIIGWVRFHKIAPAFYPFLICLWVGSLNELLSIVLPRFGYTTDINNNIYVLIEAILLCWQLKRWDGFDRHRLSFPLLIATLVSIWLLENVWLSSISVTESWFRLVYAFVLVLLAIQQVNKLILSERKSLLSNSAFLICIGIILYFTYKGMIEIFWINGFHTTAGFLINVYSVMIWINLFANIIYSFAVLWMPAKQRFILPF